MADNFPQLRRFNFYQLVELLRALSDRKADPLHDLTPEQEPIRFHAHSGLGFPT
ncbi:type VI secretion system baseplate subunit TssG, partial [Serratia microhaemolytica]